MIYVQPPVEIERKFLVDLTKVNLSGYPSVVLTQGYISLSPTTRVRYIGPSSEPEKAWITVKGGGLLRREEFEFELTGKDARRAVLMLDSFRIPPNSDLIRKRRHTIQHQGKIWTLDEFLKPMHLDGLWLAEIELEREDEPFDLPAWVTREVTQDKRFTNTALLKAWPFDT